MNLTTRRWIAGLVLMGWAVLPVLAQDAPGAAPAVPPEPVLKVAAVERALPDMLPEGTLLYIAWPGIDALAETSRDTALARMLEEPEVIRFREQWRRKVLPAIEKLIVDEIGGEAPGQTYQAAKDLLASLWRYPVAIAVIGVGVGQAGPNVDAAIVVRAGSDTQRLVKGAERLAAVAGLPTETATDVPVEGAALKELPIPGPEMPLRWGVIGDDFVISVGTGLLKHLAAGTESKGLGSSQRFAAAMKIIGGTPAAPTFFLDLKGIARTLEMFMPMFAGSDVPVLGEEGGVQKFLDGVGLGSAQSVSMAMVPEAGGFKTTLLLHAPGLGEGAGTMLVQKPLTDADLAIVPQDASWASVSNFDLLAFYKGLLAAVNSISPDTHEAIMDMIGEVEERIGLKIEADLLGAFGDTWAMFDAPSHGGVWLTGVVIVCEVKPENQLEAALRKIVAAIAEEVGDDADVTIMSEEYRGQTISFVNVARVPIPVAPAWAQYQGRWIIALNPQMVRVILDRMIDKGESILDNPDFQRGRKLMPSDPCAISYVDTRAGVRQFYSLVLPIGQMLMAMGQGQGVPIDVSMLPRSGTLTRHLFGNTSATATTKDGVLIVSHGALPVAFPAIGEGGAMVPIIASIMLPSLARARGQARRVVSATNLRSIGVAAMIYANDHKGSFPPDLQTLIDDQSISPKQLISPLDDSGAECSYVYIGGQDPDKIREPYRAILAYENPENYDGEGTNVLFLDTHVEFMKMPAFEKALAETNKRLGRQGDQPAELK